MTRIRYIYQPSLADILVLVAAGFIFGVSFCLFIGLIQA